jgi:dTDP-4-dehydrorhamnose 3,5-epimerase
MKVEPTEIPGAFLVDLDVKRDERGSFARLYSMQAFGPQGLRVDFDYCAVSLNQRKGTLRGLHYQGTPYAEAKLIWCYRGSAFDVIVDLRSDSKTHGRWFSAELRPEGPLLYVPAGVAHGFQTFEDETALQYHVAGDYHPESESGIRWDDPELNIPWPIRPPPVISERDRMLPLLRRQAS